jgi:tagatose-6-phosphate ketose/aldose isomerase
MTSSFTNLALAARGLAYLSRPEAYRAFSARLSAILEHVIEAHFDALEAMSKTNFTRAVYLGTGSNFAAGQEAALKMLEMTAGRVSTLSETYLGLRHGPMSYLNRESLVVCFLSSEPVARLYEVDLIRELERKALAPRKVLVGENIPQDLATESDVAIECPGLGMLGTENAFLVHVVVGQLLAFFRCIGAGLRPDSPSENGVINRVVESFRLHNRGENENENLNTR